jgi:hypothetical protein
MLSIGVHYTGPKSRPWLDPEPRHPAQLHQHQLALFKPPLPLPRVSRPSRRSCPFKPPQKPSHRVLHPPLISRALTSSSWHRGAKDTKPSPWVLPPSTISRASTSSPSRWCRRHPTMRAHAPLPLPCAHPGSAPYSCVPPHGETPTSPQKRPWRRRPLLSRTRAHPTLLHLFAFVCSGVGVRGLGATMSEAGNYAYKKTDIICDSVCGEVSHSVPSLVPIPWLALVRSAPRTTGVRSSTCPGASLLRMPDAFRP